VEGLTAVVEGEEVEAFHVEGDHVVVLVERKEVPDPVHLDLLPLFRQTRCLDRDRWMEELVGMKSNFGEGRQCLGRED